MGGEKDGPRDRAHVARPAAAMFQVRNVVGEMGWRELVGQAGFEPATT